MANDVERPDWSGTEVPPEKALVTTTEHGQRVIERSDWVDGEPEQVLTPVRYGDDPAEPAEETEETYGLPQAVLEDWSQGAGVEHHREIALGHIAGITSGLSDMDVRDLVEGFDQLSEAARSAILLEIGLEPRWGGGREHAQDRLDRIEARLSNDDLEKVTAWINGMSEETLTRIVGVLGGK